MKYEVPKYLQKEVPLDFQDTVSEEHSEAQTQYQGWPKDVIGKLKDIDRGAVIRGVDGKAVFYDEKADKVFELSLEEFGAFRKNRNEPPVLTDVVSPDALIQPRVAQSESVPKATTESSNAEVQKALIEVLKKGEAEAGARNLFLGRLSVDSQTYLQAPNQIGIYDTAFSKPLLTAFEELGINEKIAIKNGLLFISVPSADGKVSRYEFTPHQAFDFLKSCIETPPTDPEQKLEQTPADAHLKEVEDIFEDEPEEKSLLGKVFSRQKKSPEPQKESSLQDMYEKVAAEFGITKEEIVGIRGFENLAPTQQELVFENLREYASRGAEGYLSKVWSGIKKYGFNIEDDGVPAQGSKGMKAYGAVLTQLVRSAERFGPKVHKDENGVLVPDLVSIELDRAKRGPQYEAVRNLNIAAHKLAQTPASWQEDGLGTHTGNESKITSFLKRQFSEKRKQYEAYTEIQKGYDDAKKEFEKVLRGSGADDGEIAQRLVELDGTVFKLQFTQTSPEAETVQNITDETAWTDVAKRMATKSGVGYMALGAVSRTATAEMLGWLSGPLVAMGIASARSWNREAALLRERDRKARMGVVDGSAEALNIVQAVQTVEIDGTQQERGAIQKLRTLLEEFQSLDESKESFVEERARVLRQLKNRVEFMEDKQKLNRINFGGKEEYVSNMVELTEMLALAKMIVTDIPPSPDETDIPSSQKSVRTVKERVIRYMKYKEGSIERRRRVFQTKKVAWAATKAGAFGLAGAALVDLFDRFKEFGQSHASFMEEARRAESVVPASVERPEVDAPREAAVPTTPESVPDSIAKPLPEYRISRSDSLLKIMKSEIPTFADLDEGARLRLLKTLTPAELTQVGIRSGNINTIFAGDSLNVEKLKNILESKQSLQSDIESNTVNADAVEIRTDVKSPERPSVAGDVDTKEPTPLEKGMVNKEPLSESDAESDPIKEPAVPEAPSSPPPEKNIETKKPAVESVPELPKPTALDIRRGRILETYFLSHNVPPNSWMQVRTIPVDNFVSDTMEEGRTASRVPALVQLGKIFREVGKPPYNVEMFPNEPTEIFAHRSFTAITQADAAGKNTALMQEYLKNTKSFGPKIGLKA